MKCIAIFIFLWCIFIFTSHALAADQLPLNYSWLKNEYINNHPGQTIMPFPWETSTQVKILPFNYEIPASPDNNFSVTACRDQFESGSFIIIRPGRIFPESTSVCQIYMILKETSYLQMQ